MQNKSRTSGRPSLAPRLIRRHFGVKDRELLIENVSLRALVEQYGTPLFVYSSRVANRKLTALREALPPVFDVYYSMKANPSAAFLQCFVRRGCGLEVASTGEIHQALAAGCPASRIIYAGPGKTTESLEYALRHNIGSIHVESLLEVKRIAAIRRQQGVRARIALRVNPVAEAQGGAVRMGGLSAPFGIDEEQLDAVLDFIADNEGTLDCHGVHQYSGTQIHDYAVLALQYRHAVEIAKRVAGRLQKPLESIDFGGGLGVPYFEHEEELDLKKLSIELASLVDEIRRIPLLAKARLLIEPGRFLAAEAGLYVSRVVDVKVSRGKTFVVVDGGMHQHLAASGNLGQTIKRNFPLAVLNKLGDEPTQRAEVVGPLCTPLDTMGRSVELPHVEPGDLIGVFQSGAYGRTASPLGFLSHVSPAEVWVEDGAASLVRRHGEHDDFLRDQCLSPARVPFTLDLDDGQPGKNRQLDVSGNLHDVP